MESRWWIIFFPLALPVAAAAAGTLASVFSLAKYGEISVRRRPVLVALILLSVVAAWIPNAAQQLYDLGMSFPAIEVLQTASYFIFAFAVFGGWHLLEWSWWRWLLILLVPVSFAQPLLWTWAYLSWSIWGFAP
jgi:hypothetical protein